MKELVIHAGMHKTGSSSIQQTFSRLVRPGLSYAPYRTSNHCGLFALLTLNRPEEYHAFRASGMTKKAVRPIARYYRARFEQFLRELVGTGIVSAEDISSATVDQIRALVALLGQYEVRVRVVLYVRHPGSLLQSSFQERLKRDNSKLDPSAHWPKYRNCIEKFDSIFGQRNVTVRPFHPWEFPNGDVVEDFARLINVSISRSEICRANEALSAEATALLYLERRFGLGLEQPSLSGPLRNERWIGTLNTLGSQRLFFSRPLVKAIIEENQEDFEWVEARLGRQLKDRRLTRGFCVSCEEDLIALGTVQLDKVRDLLNQAIEGMDGPPREKVIRMLSALRSLS